MDNRTSGPLYLAIGLGAVAIVAVAIVGGLLYGLRWLVSQPMAFNNPAYMAVIVAGALIVGFGMAGVFLILHDAVDAWGDAYKAKASAPAAEPMDLETAYRAAQTAERMALARKYDRDGAAPPAPTYAADVPPWPAQENANGAEPTEWRG